MYPIALLLGWTLMITLVAFAVQSADAQRVVRPDRRTLSLWLREASIRAIVIVLRPFDRLMGPPTPNTRTVAIDHDIPVLLVPGLRTGGLALTPLRHFLQHRGWRWVWAVPGTRANASLAEDAKVLARHVATLKKRTDAPVVDIVAYSVGGLVAAWALHHEPSVRQSVRRLVTIGTPWKGTKLSVFWRGTAAEGVAYQSHTLDGLWPTGVETVCIYSPDDHVVVPASSACPQDAHSVHIASAGHCDLLLSGRVYRAVQAALSTSDIRTPSAAGDRTM